MNKNKTNFDSEDSDEEYVPDETVELPSEEESGSDASIEDESFKTNSKPNKRKKRQCLKSIKTSKLVENVPEESQHDVSESTTEKSDNDESIWKSFLAETDNSTKLENGTKKEENLNESNNILNKATTKTEPAKLIAPQENKTIPNGNKLNSFASSSPLVGKKRAGGLSALVGQLGKSNKLSTLEKSKLDWDKFKEDEGIKEELETYKKGKDGYLEKQDFLQRTDLRQFEIEKRIRELTRKK